MKKQLTTLILTATLGIFAGAGARGEADIYDITPCGEYGEDFAEGQTWSSVSAPLGSGETVYFKLRLLAREISGSTAYGRWRLDYDGLISPSVVSNLYPMQIGIYVSGVRTYAVLDNVVSEGNFTTALIFKYTTKPGDFAMPIRLATATGPAGDTPATGEYFFDPSRSYWKMRCETSSGTADCSWLITTDMGKQSLGMVDIGRAPRSDFSLEGCGIYVQTVDFSDDDESSDYWRSVHENSTITGGGISPRLAISAPSTASVSAPGCVSEGTLTSERFPASSSVASVGMPGRSRDWTFLPGGVRTSRQHAGMSNGSPSCFQAVGDSLLWINLDVLVLLEGLGL